MLSLHEQFPDIDLWRINATVTGISVRLLQTMQFMIFIALESPNAMSAINKLHAMHHAYGIPAKL